ncbi:hypothetical protein L1887_00819 [Cichorium endivia]|nr:hypothetical protein L1887_00819 [Cichorium endivia]
MVIWKAIYNRVSLMGNPEKGAAEVLNQWENEGKKITKWELCRIVKEMRKYGRHKLPLEVLYWVTLSYQYKDTTFVLSMDRNGVFENFGFGEKTDCFTRYGK